MLEEEQHVIFLVLVGYIENLSSEETGSLKMA